MTTVYEPMKGDRMRSLFEAYWMFTTDMEQRVKGLGINYGNPKIMLYIMGNEGCSQTEISRNCFLEAATVSSVLKKMEQNTLIERRAVDGNKRLYSIYLTEKGRQVSSEIMKRLGETEKIAFSGFSKKDIETLQSLLNRVIDNIENSTTTH